MAAALDSFEAELKQLRQDLRGGAISRGNYERAVKDVLTRRGIAQLEPNWWSRYTLEDAPASWVNPHLEFIWRQASPDKQDIALMVVGALKEQNYHKKAAKYAYLKKQLEKYDVFIDVVPEQFIRGEIKALQTVAAAVMEIYTPTGLYSRSKGSVYG